MSGTIIIQRGQTLSEIARQYHTSVAELVKLNHLKNANFIVAGQQLFVPGSPKPASGTAAPRTPPRNPATSGSGHTQTATPLPAVLPTVQLQQTTGAMATEFVKDGRTFPNNNGYPVYAQGKNSATHTREAWADLPIGPKTVSQIGCAMTAVTMAVSGISRQTITPAEMNQFMNKIGGFSSGGLIQAWNRMGELGKPAVKVTRRSGINANKIDQELDAGRPVVVQVDYHKGRGKAATKGYDGEGDHWILITGRSPDRTRYLANDPAGGKMMTLHRTVDSKLEGDSADNVYETKYLTTGEAATFDRGPGLPVAGIKTPVSSGTSTPKTTTTTSAKKEVATAASFVKDGRTFPTSNGYPLYAQWKNSTTGKVEDKWASLPMGSDNVGNIGCAMTSVTMAVSGISGQTVTPDEMNRFMNKIDGFTSGGGIQKWDRMGELVKPQLKVTRRSGIDAKKIDQELDAGRPVVVQVDYYQKKDKKKVSGHDGVGDHWILITGRSPDNRYMANDPAGGKVITLHRTVDGKLEGDSADNKYNTKYLTTGNATTFDRGPGAHPAENMVVAKIEAKSAKTTTSSSTSTPKTPAPPKTSTASTGSKVQGKLLQPSREVEEAIRNASAKVGVDYGYMMAMAAQESAFNPTIKASTSSATGLYQFLNQTWLGVVKQHGEKHGLAEEAGKIQYSSSQKKNVVSPFWWEDDILDLRKDPTYSALMGAEFAKDNQQILEKKLKRQVSPTDLYMAHFLGPSNAVKFLGARDAGKGSQSAVAMFPKAAEANTTIFYKSGQARTLDQVYKIMEAKIAPKAEAYSQARKPSVS
ncbi:C39 family peptidase [Archangium gephyra]|uniref:C39 family peptidase n=1 Tax=Archangium gephyra TaxID=48 RepID=UPI0035D4B828